MAKIPSEVIDEIRERSNIVDIVGQHVQLKKSGKNYLGLCPFHSEKTPSFSVAEDKQIFHCFGCGKGGNVFQFLQEMEHISFTEAVLKVAEMEQIPLPAEYTEFTASTADKLPSPLLHLYEKATEFYHHILVNTSVGQPALEYLYQRGMTDELIATFQLGFAPPQREFLERIFQNEQVPSSQYVDSGLFIERENGALLDRFYQRIMFPIRNVQGKTIAFSGRWFDEPTEEKSDQPKYVNSPETTLFNKREVLFNLDKAKAGIRKEATVYLFEGFMDVIAAWQAGVETGVASMGTSLTEQQIQQMERLATQLVFCYDGDQAGQTATYRGSQLLGNHSRLKLSIVALPEKLDPDEYIQKYGATAFVNLARHEQQTVFEFTMTYLAAQFHLENEKERVNYLELLLKELTKVTSLLEQDRYLTKIATQFDLQRETVEQQFRLFKQASTADAPVSKRAQIQQLANTTLPVSQRKTQVQKAQELLLYRMMNETLYRQQFKQLDAAFIEDYYQELYVLLDTYMMNQELFELARFLDFLQKDELKQLIIQISSLNVSEEGSEREFQDLLKQIHQAKLMQAIAEKQQQQQHALQTGDQTVQLELAMEIINLTKRLKQIN